ncbi:acyl-CoA dehydrogenase family protein [Pseudomonas sp. BF-R-19]|uniref:acyl-CoA dehydrogenase family protein n=1 Tax=Pseudomonas sp. BF-R-19 TaxID=2832397 RepID=UPI001CBCAFC0|nr:acyl-CoA dehydrogenase family protein [Pseudomonas sp. BF-R-19]
MGEDLEIIKMLRESVESFLQSHETLPRKEAVLSEPLDLDQSLWEEMAELGWLGLALPESMGGSGLGLREATTLAEQFGLGAFPAPYIASALMPSIVLSACEGDDFAQGLTDELASGRRLFTIAWQDQLGEISPDTPQTRLNLSDGKVYGVKRFVPYAKADLTLLVSVNTGEEAAVVAIDANAPGVSHKLCATALGTVAEITFNGAQILNGRPLLSGASATDALNQSLEAGRITLAAQMAGLAEGCLARTIKYVTNRAQFGNPLGSLQSVRHRCVDLHSATLLAKASWHHALGAYESTPLVPETTAASSAAKARCADTALWVARESVQLHGAMGFTEEGGIGLYLRCAMAGSAWLGSPTAHRRRFLTARGVLDHA